MPSAGDKKWRRNENPTTKAKISKEIGITTTKINWAMVVLQTIAETSMIVPWLVSLIGIGTATAAGSFYSSYKSGLKSMLETVADFSPNKEFYVEQQMQWHPGQRGWRPLNNFRAVVVK